VQERRDESARFSKSCGLGSAFLVLPRMRRVAAPGAGYPRRGSPSWGWPNDAIAAPPSAIRLQPIETASHRPDIVWIMAGDISTELSCYGHPAVRTPNLDRLAEEGVRYTNVFTTAPLLS